LSSFTRSLTQHKVLSWRRLLVTRRNEFPVCSQPHTEIATLCLYYIQSCKNTDCCVSTLTNLILNLVLSWQHCHSSDTLSHTEKAPPPPILRGLECLRYFSSPLLCKVISCCDASVRPTCNYAPEETGTWKPKTQQPRQLVGVIMIAFRFCVSAVCPLSKESCSLCVCVFVCVRARAFVCVCVRARVCVCVCVCLCVL
jgi:hypothetical protein